MGFLHHRFGSEPRGRKLFQGAVSEIATWISLFLFGFPRKIPAANIAWGEFLAHLVSSHGVGGLVE